MDVAISVFVRAALASLTRDVLAGRIAPPPHHVLVADLEACVRDGSASFVRAPHLVEMAALTAGANGSITARSRDEADERVSVRVALDALVARAHEHVPATDSSYLELVEDIIAQGSLSERIRSRLQPLAGTDAFTTELRTVYHELAGCLVRNEPWHGRRT